MDVGFNIHKNSEISEEHDEELLEEEAPEVDLVEETSEKDEMGDSYDFYEAYDEDQDEELDKAFEEELVEVKVEDSYYILLITYYILSFFINITHYR